LSKPCIILDLLTLSSCSHPRRDMQLDDDVLRIVQELCDNGATIYIHQVQYEKYYQGTGAILRVKRYLGISKCVKHYKTSSVEDLEELGLENLKNRLKQMMHGDEYIGLVSAIKRLLLSCNCDEAIICLDRALPKDEFLPAIKRRSVEAEPIKTIGDKPETAIYVLRKQRE